MEGLTWSSYSGLAAALLEGRNSSRVVLLTLLRENDTAVELRNGVNLRALQYSNPAPAKRYYP
jgi:hypothetical protein